MADENHPNRVADAAEFLKRFFKRGQHIVGRGPGVQYNDDDRAAVIAAQLLAIASQLERIGDALEVIATNTRPVNVLQDMLDVVVGVSAGEEVEP